MSSTAIDQLLILINDSVASKPINDELLSQTMAQYPAEQAPKQDIIEVLAEYFYLSTGDLQASLNALPDNDSLEMSKTLHKLKAHKAQTENDKILLFQARQILNENQLDTLDITRGEWLDIIERFETQQWKNLTLPFFLESLSLIRDTTVQTLINAFKRAQPPRHVKAAPLSPYVAPRKRRKRRRQEELNDEQKENNPLIINLPEDSSPTTKQKAHSLSLKTGVSCQALGSPFTPPKPTQLITWRKTPHGKSPLCLVARNGLFSVYKKPTPKARANSFQGQISSPPPVSEQDIKAQLKRLNCGRPTHVQFIATEDKRKKRAGKSRRKTQRQLAGASSQQVFAAHEINTLIKPRGSHYHLFHLIAFCLGGQHAATNLVPTTASANYNAFDVVENPIKQMLKEGRTERCDMDVYLSYQGDSYIPSEILFKLSWHEKNEAEELITCSQEIVINPLSYRRFGDAEKETLKLMSEPVIKKQLFAIPFEEDEEDDIDIPTL